MAPTPLHPEKKCSWCLGDPLMESYHDLEWGVPVTEDSGMFEHLVLESFQSGLSWRTVLHKRDAFRSALKNFDAESLLSFTETDREAFLSNPTVIRNRLKLEATLHNARILVNFRERHGMGFADFLWDFVGGTAIDGTCQGTWPATTPQSDELARVLKSAGFKFVGSTTLYAHMQATGLVNDHHVTCPRYAYVKGLGRTP